MRCAGTCTVVCDTVNEIGVCVMFKIFAAVCKLAAGRFCEEFFWLGRESVGGVVRL